MTTINWLMLFWEIITVYSDNHGKHANTLCWQNAKLLNVKSGGTYTYHLVSNDMYIMRYENHTGRPPHLFTLDNSEEQEEHQERRF
jgi:hypothetical protein